MNLENDLVVQCEVCGHYPRFKRLQNYNGNGRRCGFDGSI